MPPTRPLSPRSFLRRALLLLSGVLGAVPVGVAGAGAESPTLPTFSGPTVAGDLAAPPKNEASGLAASRRTPGLLWVHDDSGGEAALYAVDTNGRFRGLLQIGAGVKNDDWEDLAAAEIDRQAWLVIGDIGDNDAKRREVRVHFVPEPAADRLAVAGMLAERPAATLRIRFEDGPRDCESLAVDSTEGALYLLSKRDAVPRLYRVALPRPLAHAELTARWVGDVSHLAPPGSGKRSSRGQSARRAAWPCAMDFAADGTAAVVLTYTEVLIFPRRQGETWGTALGREPLRLPPHRLSQAEAVCFSPDGRQIFVASENSRSLLRYDRK